MFDFSSAYRQLRQSERIFVDGFVSEIEKHSIRQNLKIDQCLDAVKADDLDQQSREILARDLVRAAISERVKDLAEQSELSVDKTLKELRSMAYSNVANYIKLDGYGTFEFDLSKCTPEMMAAIKTIKIKENPSGDRYFEFVLHDKVNAMTLLMKYQGLLDAEAWRSEKAKENQQKTISAGSTVDDAADLYARSING